MTSKDYIFLAPTLRLGIAGGEIKPATVRFIAAELDNNYSNFERATFEAAAIPRSGK